LETTVTLLRVLLIDDEARARANLLHLLRAEPDIGECRVCDGGEEAVETMTAFAPELVFLDVQMPEVGGFEVVRRVGPERMPPVIFVTAYDSFALRAFEVNAVDYLLKPVSSERFAAAMRRARARMAGAKAAVLSRQLAALLGQVDAPSPEDAAAFPAEARGAPARRIVVREGARTLMLDAAAIVWISAEDYCINIYADEGSHLVRETLASFAAQLDPSRFVRVHRSAVINVDRVTEVRSLPSGRVVAVLKGGHTVPVSRSRVRALQDALGVPP